MARPHPVYRAVGALHLIGAAVLLGVTLLSFVDPIHDHFRPPVHDEHYHGGSWGWVMAVVFLVPPGAALLGIGMAFWVGVLARRFAIAEAVLAVGGCVLAVASRATHG